MDESKVGRILVVDDQANWRKTIRDLLLLDGHTVMTAQSYNEARQLIGNEIFDIIIIDIRLDDLDIYNISGLDLLRYAKGHDTEPKIIIMTGYPTPAKLIPVTKEAHQYFEKGRFDIVHFRDLIHQLLL